MGRRAVALAQAVCIGRNNLRQSLCAMAGLTHHTLQGIMRAVARPVPERKVAALPGPTQWRQRKVATLPAPHSGAKGSARSCAHTVRQSNSHDVWYHVIATIALHELRDAAAYCLPFEVQERLALLCRAKNNEGTLTAAEAAELQALVNAYNA